MNARGESLEGRRGRLGGSFEAVPTVLPLARTNAEARLFLQLQPCSGCGKSKCVFRSAVVTVGDDLGSRYTGVCPQCGVERIYEFRIPAEVLQPQVNSVQFGADDPSQLLDPGVWLWYSDICAQKVPESPAGLGEAERRACRHALATALAAVEETLKFIPVSATAVPASAFISLDGRTAYRREPGRFSRARLEAVRGHYAEQLTAW